VTVFTLYYRPESGEITAYGEGHSLPPDDECPKGSKRVCFDKVFRITDEASGFVNVKVDIKTLHILPINTPNVIVENSVSSVNPTLASSPINKEIMHA